MQKLIQGIHQFQQQDIRPLKGLFEQLARGQSPETLFITCSDSRIDPNLLPRSQPGKLFILRNAGNIIPPHGPANGGEGATIEFAVAGLGVKDILVCGHSHCGAMKGRIEPESVASLPVMLRGCLMPQPHYALSRSTMALLKERSCSRRRFRRTFSYSWNIS